MSKTTSQLIEERDTKILEQFGSFEVFNNFTKDNPHIDPFTLELICKQECPRGSCLDNSSSYHWNYSAWK